MNTTTSNLDQHSNLNPVVRLLRAGASLLVSFLAVWLMAHLAYSVYGQPFLDILGQTKASTLGLIAFSVFIAVREIKALFIEVNARRPFGIFAPLKVVFVATLLIPGIPGPINEKISPLAYAVLSLLS